MSNGPKDASQEPEKQKHSVNKFIDFYPFQKNAQAVTKQGDGPPVPSQSAETLKPNSRPADAPPKGVADAKKKKVLKEGEAEDVLAANAWAVYRYLHKRRENWFYRIDESTNLKTFVNKLQEFADYVASYLDLKSLPEINLLPTETGSTFASWSPEGINLAVTNRHPMDVFRSLAHELVHHKQNEDDELHAESGETGSDHENEANALAGIMMRNYAKNNPKLFDLEYIEEGGGLLGALFGGGNKSRPASSGGGVKAPAQKSRKQQAADDAADAADAAQKHEDDKERLLNTPEMRAKKEQDRKDKAGADAAAKEAQHKKWLEADAEYKKKNPSSVLGSTPPGKKPFGNILKVSEEHIRRVLNVLEKKKNWNQPYDVIDEDGPKVNPEVDDEKKKLSEAGFKSPSSLRLRGSPHQHKYPDIIGSIRPGLYGGWGQPVRPTEGPKTLAHKPPPVVDANNVSLARRVWDKAWAATRANLDVNPGLWTASSVALALSPAAAVVGGLAGMVSDYQYYSSHKDEWPEYERSKHRPLAAKLVHMVTREMNLTDNERTKLVETFYKELSKALLEEHGL